MRGNFVGDDALLHVVGIRQAEVLFRRDVAEHRRAIPADHRRADGAGDVIVAGSNVNDQRPERVERRFVTPFHFQVHLLFDFVHRNVAGTFDHHLNVVLPSLFG